MVKGNLPWDIFYPFESVQGVQYKTSLLEKK